MNDEKIKLSKETCEKLRCLGRKSRSIEDSIIELINHVLGCGRWWEKST